MPKASRSRFLARVLDDFLRQAEIGQHDVIAAVDQEVGRLDVEVDDVGLVRGMERGDGVAQEPLGVFLGEPALVSIQFVEGLALDVGHAEENDVAFLADVENRDDVRMAQGRDGARLVLEILDVVGVGGVLGPQDLDGDVALQRRFQRPENRAHAALGDLVCDDVVAEMCSRNEI